MLVATAAMHCGVAVEAQNKLDQPRLVYARGVRLFRSGT
jgi:hypothetical protein